MSGRLVENENKCDGAIYVSIVEGVAKFLDFFAVGQQGSDRKQQIVRNEKTSFCLCGWVSTSAVQANRLAHGVAGYPFILIPGIFRFAIHSSLTLFIKFWDSAEHSSNFFSKPESSQVTMSPQCS